MKFWKRLTCPYDNPDDPREFVFVSNTNARLGVTWNRAHPSAKRKWQRLVAVLLTILVPCWVLYACNKHFIWLFQAAFWGCFVGRGIYLRKLARADLAEFPGLPGPRDGRAEEPTADELLLLTSKMIGILIGILVGIVVLAVGVNVIAKSVLPSRKELLILAGVISLVGSVGCLFAGAIGFYLRASRKLCATLVFVGSVWCALSLAALVPELRHRSSLPSQGRILTPAELDALSG